MNALIALMGLMAKPLSYVLTGLYSVIGNYGITLAVITIIIKLALYPLYKKQILSTVGMSDLQPRMKDIQRRYKDDPEMLRIKTAELYKESGVNPMGSCLPMFIQMFIIMGLFALLRNPMHYLDSQEMIFAIHESFLWIKDLSQPDLWILPILTGLSTFIAFYLSQQNNATTMPGGSQGMQKAMMLMFPIMLVWMARSYPAGLAVYWFVGQFVQIFFNLRFAQIRKSMNEKSKKKKRHA
ncbi:YidC/Oxa1 family membrane protein insertase [Peptostreptococcaceae bacterium pGA-8]|nr:YidC/Oxa1 family membrane protein insertase [Peptostreptococcaceae bacterium pGA-8]